MQPRLPGPRDRARPSWPRRPRPAPLDPAPGRAGLGAACWWLHPLQCFSARSAWPAAQPRRLRSSVAFSGASSPNREPRAGPSRSFSLLTAFSDPLSSLPCLPSSTSASATERTFQGGRDLGNICHRCASIHPLTQARPLATARCVFFWIKKHPAREAVVTRASWGGAEFSGGRGGGTVFESLRHTASAASRCLKTVARVTHTGLEGPRAPSPHPTGTARQPTC